MKQITPHHYAQAFMSLISDNTQSSSDICRNLVSYLHRRRETKKIPSIMREIEKEYYRQQNKLHVEVYGKREPTEKIKKMVVTMIAEYRKSDPETVVISYKPDSLITGGILVKTKDTVFDMSYEEMIRQFKKRIEETIHA